MSTGTPYGVVIGRNISAARGRLQLRQHALAARMRALGFSVWRQQTVALTEKAERRVAAEEILGLALALETTIAALMSASDQDGDVALPGGCLLRGKDMQNLAGRGYNDRIIDWEQASQRVAS